MKKILTYVLLFAFISGGVKIAWNKINKLKEENKRLERNIDILNSDIEVRENKNKELIYSMESLTIKSNELSKINSDLNVTIKEMDLKIKNLQSVTKIETVIEQRIDTIPLIPSLDLKEYSFKYEDKFTELSGKIIVEDFKIDSISNGLLIEPKLYNLRYKINSDLVVINEYQYKRRWIFWKKIVGNKVHIKSENPHLSIDEIKSFQVK